MHMLLNMAGSVFTAMAGLVSELAAVAARASDLPARETIILATIIVSSMAPAMGCIIWAVVERIRSARARRAMSEELLRARADLALRDAVISAGHQAIAVIGSDTGTPLSLAGGGALLQSCLAGADAGELAEALDALLTRGTAFSRNALSADRRVISVEGRPVGRVAAVYLQEQPKLQPRCEEMLDGEAVAGLATGIAVFSADGALSSYNAAYANMLEIPEAWLDTCPSLNAVLDFLRDNRRLPEQRDFVSWKRSILHLAASADGRFDEIWHLQGGKSIRVAAQAAKSGRLVFLFDDITEQLRLESTYNTLLSVYKSTLNFLPDGVAVFGLDGRLKQSNTAFARQWHLSDEQLAGEPHLNAIADASSGSLGRDGTWEIVASGVTSAEPEKYSDWSQVTRADGRIFSLSFHRLPDGSTMVMFSDVTDIVRFELAAHESSIAAA